ncbi:MAG TPA: hypothetical protein VH062_01170 [Polyangiaceae bacterium]|jgi:hypothetical protein|nr:hypothetical protein [Polyangiaceae bacterium]
MIPNILWTLPVPSTALLDAGPVLEKRLGRKLGLCFSYEGEDDEQKTETLVFGGVEAFKCTYHRAGDASMLEAYDRLIDRGSTSWLEEVRTNLRKNGGDADGLAHLMIGFDDGPTYEVVCRSFGIDKK